GGDGDDQEVDVGEEVEAEAPVGEEAEHDQRRDQHGREHRAADEHVGEAHRGACYAPGGTSVRTTTWVPSASLERPLVATCFPCDRPSAISTQPSPRSTPSLTSRSRATPPSIRKSLVTPAKAVSAARGTASAGISPRNLRGSSWTMRKSTVPART